MLLLDIGHGADMQNCWLQVRQWCHRRCCGYGIPLFHLLGQCALQLIALQLLWLNLCVFAAVSQRGIYNYFVFC